MNIFLTPYLCNKPKQKVHKAHEVSAKLCPASRFTKAGFASHVQAKHNSMPNTDDELKAKREPSFANSPPRKLGIRRNTLIKKEKTM